MSKSDKNKDKESKKTQAHESQAEESEIFDVLNEDDTDDNIAEAELVENANLQEDRCCPR